MEPKFVRKEAFQVVGMTCPSSEGNFGLVWEQFNSRRHEIENATNESVSYGLCVPTGEERDFFYMAAIPVHSNESIPEGMVHQEIPANYYAVFTHKGSVDTISQTFDYIFGTWLATSGYQPVLAPGFELYDERFISPMHPDNETDIYVPVVEK